MSTQNFLKCFEYLGHIVLKRLLLPDESGEGEKTRHLVTVITGDVRHAGTDANVFLEIIGKHGRTGEIKLDDEKNNFERNMTDMFKVSFSFTSDTERSGKFKARSSQVQIIAL